MLRLIVLFIFIGLGLYVGTQSAGQQGYVFIAIANTTIEMSVTTLLVVFIMLITGILLLSKLIKKVWRFSSESWEFFGRRKVRQARALTNEGIIQFLEGNFKLAEKNVTRHVNHHDMPLLCYLVASEAAESRGHHQDRDHYLELASQQENSRLAVEITRSKQYIRAQDYDLAYQTLEPLFKTFPRNVIVLALLKQSYVQLKMWQPLLDLAPKLVKEKVITPQEKMDIEQMARCGLLDDIARRNGKEGLINFWDSQSRGTKKNIKLIEHLCSLLIFHKADIEAFKLIKENINKSSPSTLFRFVPDLKFSDNQCLFDFLESHLKKDPNNAGANSALARLLMKEKNWVNAQQYLEKALTIRTDLNDYGYLTEVLEQQNLTQAAHEVSKKILTIVNKNVA